MITYDLSKFSPTPFGRYPEDGKFNGTAFRNILVKLLTKAGEQNEYVLVDFDTIELGIGSSFLEESFGGLVRKNHFSPEQLIGNNGLLKIKSSQTFYIDEIKQYISEAAAENNSGK